MKMKKMLAILAALSVLGTTGLTVGAEDATTTEPVTETVTTETVATETVANVAETTVAEEETTEETETVDTKIYATKEYTMGAHTVKVVLYSDGTLDDSGNPVECMDVYVDGNITNLSGMIVNTAMNGDGSNTIREDPDSFFTVDGVNTVTVTPYFVFGSPVTYTFNEATGTFVLFGEASTTTTTTASETTTTTTTTTTSAADLEAAKKALYEVYAAKYKPAVSGYETVEYHIVDGVLTSATIIVEDQDEKVVKTFFVTKDGATLINSVRMGGMWYGFKDIDFTCDGYQFYAQIVQPASDADVRSYLTIYVYDKDGNLSVTNINGLQIGSVLYTGVDGKTGWTQGYDWVLSDFFSSNGDSITINRSIAAFIDVSTSMQYTLTSDSTTYTYDAATNTFVATNGTNSGTNSGKTDNGSASNAPASTATKGTSSTPKTGDTTTVPAVAVGLTLTAAGVVAFIIKRKK